MLSVFVIGAPNKTELDKLVDQWHVAAGKSDYNAYFDFMDKGFIFIGTAAHFSKQDLGGDSALSNLWAEYCSFSRRGGGYGVNVPPKVSL